jgi:putative DNA primase/helicase
LNIFANEAPAYWARGIPAIPLKTGFKRPAIERWQIFADRLPTESEQADWLRLYPDGNIGLPMGPASGLVAIDLDSVDPRVLAILDRVLPKSPWRRVGSKGAVYVFRFNGERTFRIKHADGSMILECLSKGAQIVLPPSIHPDTLQPYVSNVPLLDVVAIVPALPSNIEVILREALKEEGIELSSSGYTRISSFVPAGARDNALVAHAGILSRAITRGERTLLDALAEIGHWVQNYTEQVAGDEMSVEKAKAKVVEFLFRDVTGEKRRTLPKGWDEGLSDEDKKQLGLDFEEENEQWDFDRIVKYLQIGFETFSDPMTSGWQNTIDVALDRMARNPSLDAVRQERLLKFVANQSKDSITLVSLRTRLKELQRGDMLGTNHTEIAKALLNDFNRYGEVRHHLGQFWQWKGAAWEPFESAIIPKHLADEYGECRAAAKNGDHVGIIKLMQNLCTSALIKSSITGVNFANGFLNQDLELVPHHADYGMTYVLPYRYIAENTNCPLFFQLLHDSWGMDPDFSDKVMALQEAIAATLMGLAPRYQRAFCLIGQPHSGKSRIIEILRGLMPEGCASSVPPTEWGDKFMPAQMAGKLMNLAGEISESKYIAGDVFKKIVEGQEIEAQQKNQPIFKFNPRAAQWFASNHLPKTKDTSDGFNRRWLFLEYGHRISEDKKQIGIDQIILASEREQIAAWALQGLPRLIANREYTLPTSHMAAIDEMAVANNSVRYFLAQCPRLRVGRREHEGRSEISITDQRLFDEYWSFCAGTGGVQRVTQTRFHASMKELAVNFAFEQVKTQEKGAQETKYLYITLADRNR